MVGLEPLGVVLREIASFANLQPRTILLSVPFLKNKFPMHRILLFLHTLKMARLFQPAVSPTGETDNQQTSN